jgi:hypothetical protein
MRQPANVGCYLKFKSGYIIRYEFEYFFHVPTIPKKIKMKTILISMLFLPLLSFSQWQPCQEIFKGILRAEVHGDTVILKNDTAYRNCYALYKMVVSQSNDTIIWLQSDTGSVAGCLCHFNLAVTIDSLQTGHYYLKAYFETLEGDTTCFIGLIEFDIIKQNSYSSHKIIDQGQSDCFPVGIDESPINENNDLIVYPSPTSGIINILTKDNSIKEIYIFDINSNKVFSFQSTETINTIDVSVFPPGIYFIKVLSNKQVNNIKFCKY